MMRAREGRLKLAVNQDGRRAVQAACRALGSGAAAADVASLADAVADDAILRRADLVCDGLGPAMAAALADLAHWPDGRWLTEDTLTLATPPREPEPGAGMLVALRSSLLARDIGCGMAGPATGRRVRMRSLGEFWVDGHGVRDAWIVRDTAAALAQSCGTSPRDAACAVLDAAGDAAAPQPLDPDTDLEGPYAGRGNPEGPAGALEDAVTRIMDGEMRTLWADAHEACEHALPGGQVEPGPTGACGFWAGLRSALPSASFRVDHRCGMAEAGTAPRAALRWSLYGRHDGPGRFGPPTGAYVNVLGLTQAEFGPGGLRRTWTLIDDVAIWIQILRAAGRR